jgi:hypothetical protein
VIGGNRTGEGRAARIEGLPGITDARGINPEHGRYDDEPKLELEVVVADPLAETVKTRTGERDTAAQ